MRKTILISEDNMWILGSFIAIFLLLGMSSHCDKDQNQRVNDGIKNPTDREMMMNLESLVAPYVNTHNFSGNILAVRGDKVLFEKSYGMANIEHAVPVKPETKFYIASITKSFTAAAILRLQEQGLLKVTDPVSRFIPDYPNGDKITIHHLLMHTSGLPRVFTLPDYKEISRKEHTPEEMVNLMKNQPLLFAPGKGSGYSGANYHLLAYIIERISGMSYDDSINKNFLEPLGLSDTGNHASWKPLLTNRASGYDPVGMDDLANSAFYDYSTEVGSGSMYATCRDLDKWIKGLFSGRVLKPESIAQVLEKEELFGRDVYFLNGWSNTGFSSSLIYFPEDDLTIVVLSNVDISSVTNELAKGISATILGEDYPALTLYQNPVNPELAKKIAGTYRFGDDWYSPGASWRIVARDGQIYGEDHDGTLVGFLRVSELEFIHRGSWGRARFDLDENGEIRRMLFYGRFWAEKVNE